MGFINQLITGGHHPVWKNPEMFMKNKRTVGISIKYLGIGMCPKTRESIEDMR